jgi:pimeloyl-ACP methyl ester carboxylesterase
VSRTYLREDSWMHPKTGSARVGDGLIAYDEAGTGPAVVFSHAAIANRRMWDEQFRALAPQCRVIRYDWRGVGDSDSPTGTVCHFEDLLGLLDALEIEDAVLVGCSMGGAHALDAALAAPNRVRGLVLISSALSGHVWPSEMYDFAAPYVRAAVPPERMKLYQMRSAREVLAEDVAAMAEVQARLLLAGPNRGATDVDPAAWQLALEMLRDLFTREWSSPPVVERQLEPAAVGRLAEVRVPTIVVNGLEDLPWIQHVSDLISTGIDGAVRIDLTETAHLAPIERPGDVARIIERLL